MSKRNIKREARPTTATSTGVRSVWLLAIICGLILIPLTGPLAIVIVIGGIVGLVIG